MVSRKQRTSVFSGGVIHNAIHATPGQVARSTKQLRWTADGIDPVGDHAKLCDDTNRSLHLFWAECGEDTFMVGGAHAVAVRHLITFSPDTTDFTHDALNSVKYGGKTTGLVLALNDGRATFHQRVAALAGYRLPRTAIEQILSGVAHEVDWHDTVTNRVAAHVLHLVNGNPYNVDVATGVNRQACLMYLYLGHLVDS